MRGPTQPRPSAFSPSASASSGLYSSLPLAHQVPAPESRLCPARARSTHHTSSRVPLRRSLSTVCGVIIVLTVPGPPDAPSGHRTARANSRIESLVMAGEMPGTSTAGVQAPRLGARRSEAQTPLASVHTPGCRGTSVPSLWA